MVNILEIRPFLTMKALTHGPKILARKSSNMGLDDPKIRRVSSHRSWDRWGGIICPPPPLQTVWFSDPPPVRVLKRMERLHHRFLMWLGCKTQPRCPSMDYASLLSHFNSQTVKARFIQADIKFLQSVLHGRLDCQSLVSTFSPAVPSQRTRHTGMFHVPGGRVKSVRNSFLSRIPATCNALLKKVPETDFFYSPSSFRSQVLKFANSEGTYWCPRCWVAVLSSHLHFMLVWCCTKCLFTLYSYMCVLVVPIYTDFISSPFNPPPPGGGGSDPTPPLGFSGITSWFITVSTWNLAHLSEHQFGVVSCKENQNRPEIFHYRSNFVTSLHAILGR